ncbi:MAG TPA: N-acetyltransferase [Devosia sp.]|nr:N-acetyltransferase [Devosia sp.]
MSPELCATVHLSTSSIEADIWNALVPGTNAVPDNPFLDHAFFLALEASGSAVPETGWQPQHIVLSRGQTPVGLMPLFLKSHSQGEYVFDHAWAEAIERAGGRYYPKLQCSVPFTPVSAPKLLVPSGEAELKSALLDTAQHLAERLSASSVHATFVTEQEAELAENNQWLVRHDTQFHWHNKGYSDFIAFLASLSSRKRKAIKRERRQALVDGLAVEWISGNDLTETHWDHFFEFYQNTGARKWGQPYLTRQFFSLLSQTMPERIVLMLARDGSDYVAGALNLVGKETIYGRYWGCSRDIAFLHFEMCYYQAIDYAIAHKLKTVEAGAQGPHKLARGYAPVVTRSIHWLQNPSLRRTVAGYLEQERKAVARDQEFLAGRKPYKKQEN